MCSCGKAIWIGCYLLYLCCCSSLGKRELAGPIQVDRFKATLQSLSQPAISYLNSSFIPEDLILPIRSSRVQKKSGTYPFLCSDKYWSGVWDREEVFDRGRESMASCFPGLASVSTSEALKLQDPKCNSHWRSVMLALSSFVAS